ncbi:hypothetical protein BJY52DRAFT_1352066 [Lactarius psammicola]|nr:hypothetical protein BJY52DRAFT_1352066 [Lactarius psammicola]
MSSDKIPLHSAPSADSAPIHEPHNGPEIEEIIKRSNRGEIGESSVGDQSHGKAISVHTFPDSVLLEIFDLCRSNRGRGRSNYFYDEPSLEWQLVHVCQKWRYLIFASSSRLNLELLCTKGTPVRKGLGCWPAFPIVIKYDKVAPEDEDNVIAALEHPDRVRRITLADITKPLWGKMDAAMHQPFPSLTHLRLTGPKDQDERAPVLPRSLLGGGTLRLQEVYLRGISYPGLPKFLSSASDLVRLEFVDIPWSCQISPETMATGLAGLNRLKTLSIEFRSPIPPPGQRLPAPATPVVCLPALSVFTFRGFCEYLEDLVAQIDAPRVETFAIEYFSEPVYQLSQLSRFLGRSEYLKAPQLSSAEVRFIPWVHLVFIGYLETQGSSSILNLRFSIKSSGMVRGVLHSVQVLQQISASLSNVVELSLIGPAPPSDEPPFGGSLYSGSRFGGSLFGETLFGRPLLELPGVPDRINHIDWIEFLRPFTALNSLVLRGELSENIIRALEWLRGDLSIYVLPALHSLQFIDKPSISVERFVSTRQNAGRPVTIIYPSDSDWDGV